MYDAEEEHLDTAGCTTTPFIRRPFPDVRLSRRLKVGKRCIMLLIHSLSGVKFVRHFNNARPSCSFQEIELDASMRVQSSINELSSYTRFRGFYK